MAVASVAPAPQVWKPSHNPWAVALTVTLATFMEVLDTSIANVALPHIGGSLSATQEESTWVLTSYLVSNAIILPISAWLSTIIGRKRFYMLCVLLFTVSSFMCGLATSLGMLVFFRILQGCGGGGLAPSEQSILADTFPPSKRGMAFALYGVAVVFAPAIGPTLGGWITDNFSWQWIFFINIPVGILSLFLTNRLVEDPPYIQEERKKRSNFKIDGIGLGLIIVAVGCIQVALDKGQEEDWFASTWITLTLLAGVLALIGWILWEWFHPAPIVDLHLFKNRNFATAMFFTFNLGAILYGTTVFLPQFLQTLLGYPATAAGEAMAGGGITMMLMFPIAGALVTRIDPRIMMGTGFLVTAWSLYHIASSLSLQMDFPTAAMLRVYQSAGLAFIFLPSNTLAYVGISPRKTNQVSSMNAFVRNIGGSIGIALLFTMTTRQAQKHRTYLIDRATPANYTFQRLLNGLTHTYSSHGSDAARSTQRAYSQISGMVAAQAATLAYIDVIYGLALIILCITPCVLIMKRGKRTAASEPMH